MQTLSSARRTCMAFSSAVECTATVDIPSSRQARRTRRAISPRLAIRTLSNNYEGPYSRTISGSSNSTGWPSATRMAFTRPARGEGIWRALAPEARRFQLQHMIDLVEELYPTFRWFLFDGLQRYAAPVTIFGPKRAALYVGTMYFVFTGTEQIRVLTRYFDDLIRAAVVQPPDIIDLIDGLIMRLPTPKEKAVAKSTSSAEG